ncbi:hypothetical protein COOONC_20310 [Cooperia oncophora]
MAKSQNWSAKFRSGDFSLKVKNALARPVEVDDDLIKAISIRIVKTTREIAENLHVSNTCIENHLKQLVQKLDAMGSCMNPPEEENASTNCDLPKKPNKNDPFSKRLITGDEKGLFTTIPSGKDHGASQFGGITKELSTFELLPPNRTINSDVYIERLTKLNNAVEEKRPEFTNRKDVAKLPSRIL